MKILIELPTWLGDTVMATPAIENLSNFFNDSEITLIGSIVAIETLKNHPKVIKTYVLKKNYFNLYNTIKSFGEFDVFFSFRSSFRSKFMKFCISSKKKYQFDKNKFINAHQVEKYNNFVNNCMGVNYPASSLKVYKRNNNLVAKIPKSIVGINPGASYGDAKRWYPKEFGKVAVELSSAYDILIIGGPSEIKIAADIENFLIKNDIKNYKNLAGKTSISELINLISELNLFITGDSGPMHLAASFQVPTVSIFGPTESSETSQWLNEKSVIIKKNLDCQPCMQRICPLGHHDCMKLIKAKTVLNEISVLKSH